MRAGHFKELVHAIVGFCQSSAGKAGRLKTQGRVNVAVLSLKASWRQNSFYFQGSQSFLLWSSADQVRPTHRWKVIYSKSTDLNVNHITSSQRHLDWCLTKQLDTIAYPSGYRKLAVRAEFPSQTEFCQRVLNNTISNLMPEKGRWMAMANGHQDTCPDNDLFSIILFC